MKARVRRDSPPDELIAAALDLLAQAGALPVPLLTVAEAAVLIGISTEGMRCWCRAGLGFYDRRLRQFLIPLGDLRRAALEKAWISLAKRCADLSLPS